MIFENKREIVKEVKVGDIVICNEQLYIITYDLSNRCYGYVNLHSGHQWSKLDNVSSVMSQFKTRDVRYFSNEDFTLTLK